MTEEQIRARLTETEATTGGASVSLTVRSSGCIAWIDDGDSPAHGIDPDAGAAIAAAERRFAVHAERVALDRAQRGAR